MSTFYAVDPATGTEYRWEHDGADRWSRADWDFMAEQARINPGLIGTVSANGIIKLHSDIVKTGTLPDYYTVAVWLGGLWLSDFKPSTEGTVTLEEGEVQTPEGILGPNYVPPVLTPPPTVSGSIPPGPTSNTDPNAPTTTPINPNVVVLPPTTASGGSGSSGSAIPQISPAGTTPAVTTSTATPTTTAPNNNTMLLLLVAVVVVLYFVAE